MSPRQPRCGIPIPEHWSDEQAAAVFDLLQDLTDAVWRRYDLAIIEQTALDVEQGCTRQADLFDIDDNELPF